MDLTQPRVENAWYVACRSHELRVGAKPMKRAIWGKPMVLFRDSKGQVACFLDACPHRTVPLSYGKVVNDRLQCGYHGWEFDVEGRCKRVPSLQGEPDTDARCAKAFPVREQQGFIWVWANLKTQPDREPHVFEYADKPGYTTVRHEVRAKASVHAVAENALDVPHTAFLHGGLFRNDADRNEIRAVVQRWHDRVECEYIGEPRPTGLAARMLSPSGGVVIHYDRFFLPSIVQVEYRIGDENHILLNGACTPVDEYDTRLYAVVCIRSRIPGWIIRPFVQPVALRIFAQDAEVLELQTDRMHELGEQAFVSTDVDLLGPHILRLMRKAAKGTLDGADQQPYRKEIMMNI